MSCNSQFGPGTARTVDERIYTWMCPNGTVSSGLKMEYTNNSAFVDNEKVSMSCCPQSGVNTSCNMYGHKTESDGTPRLDNDGTQKQGVENGNNLSGTTREWNCPEGSSMTGLLLKPNAEDGKFKTYLENVGVKCCSNLDATSNCNWTYFMGKNEVAGDLQMMCPSGTAMSGVKYRIGDSGKLRDEEVSVKCCNLIKTATPAPTQGSTPATTPESTPEPLRACTSSDYDWGPCSTTCGGGTQDKIKKSGVQCNGPLALVGVGSCGNEPCPTEIPTCGDADYQWSTCTNACGVTMNKELRKKSGIECQGSVVKETQACPVSECPCAVSDYYWTTCSANCGGGTRQFKKMPGRTCTGDEVLSTENCNEQACEEGAPNVNCEYNDFGEFSSCSNKCGDGTQSRSRTVKVEASGSGTPCRDEDLLETQNCSDLSGCHDPNEEEEELSDKKTTSSTGATTNYYDYGDAGYQIDTTYDKTDNGIYDENYVTDEWSVWWIAGIAVIILLLMMGGFFLFFRQEEKPRFSFA